MASVIRSGLVKHDIFCKQGLHTLSRLCKVREMTFQVEIKTNYSTRVLVVRVFTGGSSKWNKDCEKKKPESWMEGASDDVDGEGGVSS